MSDNQGIKEETFIQMVGGAEMGSHGGEDSQQGSAWMTGADNVEPDRLGEAVPG